MRRVANPEDLRTSDYRRWRELDAAWAALARAMGWSAPADGVFCLVEDYRAGLRYAEANRAEEFAAPELARLRELARGE